MNKTIFDWSIIILSACFCSLDCFGRDMIKKEDITKTLFFPKTAQTKKFAVDNIQGSIDLAGENRPDVLLAVHKEIKARSEQKIDQADAEVRLDISENVEVISVFVNAPSRQKDGSVNCRGYRHDGYEVRLNFVVKVPEEVAIYLSTINDGDISVKNIAGDFDVKNINGSITMSDLSGSGRAYALNGKVELNFKKNPRAECYFGSLNDEVTIYFLQGLAADLVIKTFNGDVYTDFPVTYLPDLAVEKEKQGNQFVYKTGHATKVRIAQGGPSIELDAFNGDINILRK